MWLDKWKKRTAQEDNVQDEVQIDAQPSVDDKVLGEETEVDAENATEKVGFSPEEDAKGQSGNELGETKTRKDGCYRLMYDQDGVFLEISPPQQGGERINVQQMIFLVRRKGFTTVSSDDLTKYVLAGQEKRILMAPPQQEVVLNEEVRVSYSKDSMEAYVELLSPEEGGSRLDKETLIGMVEGQIAHGLDRVLLEQFVAARTYGEKILVARGTLPKNGKDGELIFHFDVEPPRVLFDVDDEQKIDFKSMSHIRNVDEGTLLVSRLPAKEGEDGSDVLGKRSTAKKGKEVTLPRGKNTSLSDDKMELRATLSGNLTYVENMVSVQPILVIEGDVDLSVGNIEFNGEVYVKGNVGNGFTIKAHKKVTVDGVVEGASIESDEDIILVRGIQGADKGVLHAGGSVFARFVERATVYATHSICVDFVLHSTMNCDGYIRITTNKGALIGGHASAIQYLAAKTIGADSGIATNVEIGISPEKRERFKYVAAEIVQYGKELKRMDTALHAKGGTLAEGRNATIKKEMMMKMLKTQEKTEGLKKEYEVLYGYASNINGGYVHVTDTVYFGTRIAIGSASYNVKSDEQYVTYKNDGGDIVWMPCNYNPKTEEKRKKPRR